MRPTTLLRTAAALALLASPLTAQSRSARVAAAPMNARDGYSVSLGLGGGSNGLTCTGCNAPRENGASGYLRLGKGMTPSMMMGVELNGWNKNETNGYGRTGMLSAIAQWYPSLTNGFFAKAGAGVGRTTIEDRSVTPSDKLVATGFGYQFGAGYDMAIARRWSITPYANYLATTGANATLNGTSMNQNLDANYVQYGLGLSWH